MKRTSKQNDCLHLYFELLADELNLSGLDMRTVLKPEIDIPWSKETVKEYLWRPVMKIQCIKKSTTEMDTKEVKEVYETLNRHLGEKLHIHVPWPVIPTHEDFMN